MYIHSYQIHNVLNVYRKQLSQGPGARSMMQAQAQVQPDRVDLSKSGQRQSLIDQVSAEIVDRIAQAGPQKRFQDTLSAHMEDADGQDARVQRKEAEFTYTAIDENNRKSTNTLPIGRLSPLIGGVTQKAHQAAEDGTTGDASV